MRKKRISKDRFGWTRRVKILRVEFYVDSERRLTDRRAAFKALLMRHSGQTDLVVGSPFAGRTVPGTETITGPFLNTLPLRFRVPEAARLLRPGGRLVFLTNSFISYLTAPDEGGESDTLQRPQFGPYQMQWPGETGIEYHLAHGDWIDLLRTNGFEIERLIELKAPPEKLQEIVERAKARSVVYDILSNPVDVDVQAEVG